ncbi:MAG TPA: LppX_LprAFG lipoprotein [Candidatus Dormibacteraeota bacterium]
MKRLLAAMVVAATAAGCGGGSTPPVDAAKVLRDGAAAMSQLQTVNATLKLTKGTVTIQGFTLVSARTSVKLPADSDTTYTVKEQDILFSLEVVISAGRVYVHLPLASFRELTGSEAGTFPDMAKLFDPTTGLPAVIPQGVSPKFVSTDQVAGVSADQIATTYTPQQIQSLLSQLNSSGPVSARVWVDTGDHRIRKAVLDGAFGDGGKEAAVQVDISGFNATVVISSPTP